MRIFVVFAHPVETSFAAILHNTVVATLQEAGHDVDDCDLYAENFQPIMSREERLNYHDQTINTAPVQHYVGRLQQAQALVFCFPIWNYGPPAMMKGFFDRVFVPGISFQIGPKGELIGALTQVKKVAAVVTYGGSRLQTFLAGDPPRKFMSRAVRNWVGFRTPVHYIAQHDMNNMTEARGQVFIEKVRSEMLRF